MEKELKNSFRRYDGEEKRIKLWHLHKNIPIALFLAILSQTALIIWKASEISSAVKTQALSLSETNKRVYEIEARERDNVKLSERVVRVEAILENVQRTVIKIDDAIITKRGKP